MGDCSILLSWWVREENPQSITEGSGLGRREPFFSTRLHCYLEENPQSIKGGSGYGRREPLLSIGLHCYILFISMVCTPTFFLWCVWMH